jgi:integrase
MVEMPSVVTDFMIALHKRLMDEKKVAETTANKYIMNLTTLNGGKPFKSLAFLRKTEEIDKRLAELAPSTRLAYNAGLTSVLSLMKSKPGYKKAYEHYAKATADGADARRAVDPHEKTEKQEKAWLTWEDVSKTRADLEEAVDKFKTTRALTAEQYETLLQYLLVSLYTMIAPRRNLDYEAMCIVPKVDESSATDKNYLDYGAKEFVFNRYKTARRYGQQKEAIPEELWEVIQTYLKFHPLMKKKLPKSACIKFLVKQDGSPLNSANGITRLLNKSFGKRVGASMLRHIYLSEKYGDTIKDMEETAAAMGHSVAQQKEYVKNEVIEHV